MESSEDDAGIATSASRRASAREKDVGQAEDVDGTHESSETRASCRTPAMSEDNFDGDSVPSPSTQNTSTEAILDMIDEIVDGPGAPKRLPLRSVEADDLCGSPATPNVAESRQDSDTDTTDVRVPIPLIETSSAASDNCENVSESVVVQAAEGDCTSNTEISICVSVSAPEDTTQACSSVKVDVNEYSSLPQLESDNSVQIEDPPPLEQPTTIPSSSIETMQTISDTSDSENIERTVKSLTSCEHRDNITVERAESTSSDCSVSESKTPVAEPVSRSPLKRKLIRPVPSDRRPDSTVSSTVDSQTVDVHNTEQTISETIAKYVSSSSDAVPTVHDNIKPAEISKVSEISICQAETSTAPSRKIKLVRPKVATVISSSAKSGTPQSPILERNQCVSTSSDEISSPLSSEPSVGTLTNTPTIIPGEIKSESSDNTEQPSQQITEPSQDITQKPAENVTINENLDEKCCESQKSVKEPPEKPLNKVEDTSDAVLLDKISLFNDDSITKFSSTDVKVEKLEKSTQESKNVKEEALKVSPIKLSSSTEVESIVEDVNQVEVHPSTKNESTDVNTVTPCNDESTKPSTHINVQPEIVKEMPKREKNIVDDVSHCNTEDDDVKKVPPIKLSLLSADQNKKSDLDCSMQPVLEESLSQKLEEPTKQVPKLTIKLTNKHSEEAKSPGPKLTIKPIKPPVEENKDYFDGSQPIPSVTKINIKPIPKPIENVNDSGKQPHPSSHQNDLGSKNEHIPNITKLNIKPIPKPPEKINETHRKSSSSEISESECSENDESTSTSDQASASEQGPSDTVPKVTIKLGKPGTDSEGKFYTETIPKLTIKNVQHVDKEDQESKLKVVVTQSDDKQLEKIPKLTIKTVMKPDSQPLSPKLTIKPLKPPENVNKDTEIPKLRISTESFSPNADLKEYVPKLTIKNVTKRDTESPPKTPKKLIAACDSSEHIPTVTKLNIKPVLKPTESCGESSERWDDKVPVVSKLNIKPIIKPKDNEVDSSVDDMPKPIKLNIKPLKNPEERSSDEKDCDEINAEKKESSIPVVTKLNIKPIVKPVDEDPIKDSENQSSETGNSSDDNTDHIPIVTKLTIKPIVKPSDVDESSKSSKHEHNEPSIPVVTKLNIKPLVKTEDNPSPSSPKKESGKSSGTSPVPVVTKLNIKPIVKPSAAQDATEVENIEKSTKNPPLVMVINMKNLPDNLPESEHLVNNIPGPTHSPKISSKALKTSTSAAETHSEASSKLLNSHSAVNSLNIDCNPSSPSLLQVDGSKLMEKACDSNIVLENLNKSSPTEAQIETKGVSSPVLVTDVTSPSDSNRAATDKIVHSPLSDTSEKNVIQVNSLNETRLTEQFKSSTSNLTEGKISPSSLRHKKAMMQNCTLLKKLLSSSKEDTEKCQNTHQSNCFSPTVVKTESPSNCNDIKDRDQGALEKLNSEKSPEVYKRNDLKLSSETLKMRSIQEIHREADESVTQPLEISITDKIPNQISSQDSPRIILKINKTDQGASSKIITEDYHRTTDCSPLNHSESILATVNDSPISPKKNPLHSKRKNAAQDTSPVNITIGKRLRSSRILEKAEISPTKRNINKRPSVAEAATSPPSKAELSVMDSKRMKLEKMLSMNKSLTITPVISKNLQKPTGKPGIEFSEDKKAVTHNHSLLNNDNCSQKNGNSKLHNILTNLQAKQMQSLQLSESSSSDKMLEMTPEIESNTSTGSSEVIVEITRIDNCHPEVQEMLINENSICDSGGTEEISQDPLEVASVKPVPEKIIEAPRETPSIQTIDLTPAPRKRGRPRKQPLSESAKPPPTPETVPPPPPATERPQRSLRLMRDKPVIISKPRGRGRGRGRRLAPAQAEPARPADAEPEAGTAEERAPSPIDPTSSRIKLPRMTEALDKSVACTTPLTSRRRSSATDLKLFGEAAVVLESAVKVEEYMKTPERPRGGRGSRGGQRGRTPRGRGRGRGGGRGAMYMKETLGIYGRVCGPATTTVQLFEEETCMMDDNATPKPSHLLDEDSQSSVKSSTNDSSKMKKSKFADLFDSNKVWTAADVKEYTWPLPESENGEPQIMMIQEQVAMFLGVKSFKRRYPELKRRAVGGGERDYVLSKGLVSEALCDLGITAVDASEVLDIMLSDYPHKYEEYRAHQRERQMTEVSKPVEDTTETKPEEVKVKVEVKVEKISEKPEPPKIDPEKTRQDMAAAAIASASEWNARANAWRRPACVDLQSMTVHRRRAPPPPPGPPRVAPPHGFYPHAVLHGQYQHWYRTYTDEQLRYFPLNTVVAAPPAPSPAASSSESEGSWPDSSSSDDSDHHRHPAKRKKLTKTKRSSQQDKDKEEEGEVETCRACKLRLEANRKYTHERFLVCAECNCKLHPGCVELSADTIRKCREYAWRCAQCKRCGVCDSAGDAALLHCDLCDRAFHAACLRLDAAPPGRWHCVECAVCKSCGAREPGGLAPSEAGPSAPGPGPGAGPAEWHHQTKRGPGGHKVYSHSLCTPCARAYRIGRYCPLCERSFIGPKGTMQLVICKLCDRQLHQECVRQRCGSVSVLDYTCGGCRRGGITSRAAAVRAAPRTIATLFMAKRRFNKYAHRQYLESRRRHDPDDSAD